MPRGGGMEMPVHGVSGAGRPEPGDLVREVPQGRRPAPERAGAGAPAPAARGVPGERTEPPAGGRETPPEETAEGERGQRRRLDLLA